MTAAFRMGLRRHRSGPSRAWVEAGKIAVGGQQHLRVEFAGAMIRLALDGKPCIGLADNHIIGAGAVGVWTQADSVTAFSDFAYEARP